MQPIAICFTALPGGDYDFHGECCGVGSGGNWWSSTEYDADYAWFREMNCVDSHINSFYYYKEFGFSVRRVRD